MLQHKNIIVYGAGGSIGAAVAHAFAKAGARLFLSGRHLEPVEQVCREIRKEGGIAEAAEVNALNKEEIEKHLRKVVQTAGTLDVSFNAIAVYPLQGIPLTEMQEEDFLRPISLAMQSQFLTATVAARIMTKQRSGVLLSLSATPGGTAYPYVGGFGPVCCGIESLSRNLAAELGTAGIRAVNIRSAGSPDSRVFAEAMANNPEAVRVITEMAGDTMLKKLPPMADIANLAVFLASDLAASITGVTVDSCAGTTNGLNYKTSRTPFAHK